MQIRKGTILGFRGSWGSGIGTLEIKDAKTNQVEQVPCENAPTVRSLEAAFGNVITQGHTANGNGYKGKEIFWAYDDMGLVMAGFQPVETADFNLIEAYEKQEDIDEGE